MNYRYEQRLCRTIATLDRARVILRLSPIQLLAIEREYADALAWAREQPFGPDAGTASVSGALAWCYPLAPDVVRSFAQTREAESLYTRLDEPWLALALDTLDAFVAYSKVPTGQSTPYELVARRRGIKLPIRDPWRTFLQMVR